jgi:hypothetical protein
MSTIKLNLLSILWLMVSKKLVVDHQCQKAIINHKVPMLIAKIIGVAVFGLVHVGIIVEIEPQIQQSLPVDLGFTVGV